jgi:uncharacterized linocin/CFP29 family protein
MSHLLRDHAPITSDGWQLIDDEARERLTPGLGARRLVDFAGPRGWEHSATSLGRVTRVEGDGPDGVEARRRRVLELVELRAPFALERDELRAGDRGAQDVDFAALDAAAQRLVAAENAAIFHGWSQAGIAGVVEAAAQEPLEHGGGVEAFPGRVAAGVERLLRGGVGGPYGLALGRETWTRVVETAEHGGYPLLRHLREIMGGPTVWAPGVRDAVLVSLRGGDYLFDCGQDLSVGYDAHDARVVELYLEESFSFRVVTPEAAVPLVLTG